MNETMIAAPSTTIWGRVQHREKLANGVYIVETARHGGVVVHYLVADKYLSKEAKEVAGCPEYGWYHFEEDCDVYVFINECYDICPKRWQEISPERGTPAKEVLRKKEADRKAAREAYERTVAESRKQDAFRRELLDHDWTKGDKLYQLDGYTVSIGQPDSTSHQYPCTFNVNGEERTIMMHFDTIYTILTAEKKNN